MAASEVSVRDRLVIRDLGQCRTTEGEKYLEKVMDFVSSHKDKHLVLQSPREAVMKFVELDDTIYIGKPDEVNGWGKFYLPDVVNMVVLGVVKGTSCPCDELVLMTCEDKNVYAYDGEELHLVASSLQNLIDKGMEYPASKSYYNGEAFKDMTERDWAEVKKGDVWKSLVRDKKPSESNKATFLENLKSQK